MPFSWTSSPCEWKTAIHLSDPTFTSRVEFADAYVLPRQDASTAPTAELVSPWLLCTSSANVNNPVQKLVPASSSSPLSTTAAYVETVPLAWRCPTCGSLEVEQLFWRRLPRRRFLGALSTQKSSSKADITTTTAISGAAARRAALARQLRLQGLSPAIKAKLERHRRRRERREEMRWRSLHVSTRCRQCFLCPRCGGHGSIPSRTERDGIIEASSPGPISSIGGVLSVSALDIRLTNDMHYFTVCPSCQWHSYQAFPSMEQLISYLDSTIGEDKAEVMRDWRTSQRSANGALRSHLREVLMNASGSEIADDTDREILLPQAPPTPTVSQAAWETYKRQQAPGAQRHSPPNTSPRGKVVSLQEQNQLQKSEREAEVVTQLHPAVALEELRRQEVIRRANLLVDKQSLCVPPGATQVMRVMDLAQEAWAYFSDKQVCDLPPTTEAAKTSMASMQGGRLTEVDLITHTQHSLMNLRTEAVDTRALTLHEWMQRYQPAAIISQQRKAAATAAAETSRVHPSPTRGTALSTTATNNNNNGSSPSALAAFLSTLPEKTPAKTSGTPIKPIVTTPSAPLSDGAPIASTPEPRNSIDSSNAILAAATPNISALYHTPTSAYLQSLLQREHDRALGLPAYCVPHGRKELLTGLVWRLPPTVNKSGANEMSDIDDAVQINGVVVPCTRVVVLDRSALSDSEMRRVFEHWSQLLEKQAERLSEGQQQPQKKKNATGFAGDDGGNGSGSDADENDLTDLLASENVALQSRATGALVHSSSSPSSPPATLSARKSKKTMLPLPLFMNGTDFVATSALPCWQYIGNVITQRNGRPMLEWRLRLINLQPQHDLYVTKLTVSSVSVRGGGLAENGESSSSTSPSVELLLSSVKASTVQLPVVLRPRCSPEERALLARTQLPSANVATTDDAAESRTPPPPSPAFLSLSSPQQSIADLPRLTELIVTLTMTANQLTSGISARSCRECSVYVALTAEVHTPLPEVSSLHPQIKASGISACATPCCYKYNSVPHGVTVLLTSV